MFFIVHILRVILHYPPRESILPSKQRFRVEISKTTNCSVSSEEVLTYNLFDRGLFLFFSTLITKVSFSYFATLNDWLVSETVRYIQFEGMKTSTCDPWTNCENICPQLVTEGNYFEDCFVESRTDQQNKLPDSEQYLQSLYSKLKAVQGGTSKKDLVNSLTAVKEDCIARLLTDGYKPKSEEESELAANPLVRHIAPHLQALAASELVQLLEADVLQAVTDEQNDKNNQTTSE